jgi:hypothetical protein
MPAKGAVERSGKISRVTNTYGIMQDDGIEIVQIEMATGQGRNVRNLEIGVTVEALQVMGDGFDIRVVMLIENEDVTRLARMTLVKHVCRLMFEESPAWPTGKEIVP